MYFLNILEIKKDIENTMYKNRFTKDFIPKFDIEVNKILPKNYAIKLSMTIYAIDIVK